MNLQEENQPNENSSEVEDENLVNVPRNTNELCLKGVSKFARDNQIKKELS